MRPTDRGSSSLPEQKTPYVCRKRYDGSPFLEHPKLEGKPEVLLAADDHLQDKHQETMNPTPVHELEDFLQTWLYFGFLSEALCLNSRKDQDESSARLASSSGENRSQELVDQII